LCLALKNFFLTARSCPLCSPPSRVSFFLRRHELGEATAPPFFFPGKETKNCALPRGTASNETNKLCLARINPVTSHPCFPPKKGPSPRTISSPCWNCARFFLLNGNTVSPPLFKIEKTFSLAGRPALIYSPLPTLPLVRLE